MLKKDRNQLFEVVKNIGFPLSGLETYIADDPFYDIYPGIYKSCFVIKIRNTNLEFWVWNNPNNYNNFEVRMSLLREDFKLSAWMNSMNLDHGLSYVHQQVYLDIGEVCIAYEEWFSAVVKVVLEENNTPDLWAQLETNKLFSLSSAFSQEDIEPFTSEEKVQIRKSVHEFRRLLFENIQTTNEQKDFINERLDYLDKAVDRLNRFDWKTLAVGIASSIIINMAVDTETGKLIFHLLEQAFHTISHLFAG